MKNDRSTTRLKDTSLAIVNLHFEEEELAHKNVYDQIKPQSHLTEGNGAVWFLGFRLDGLL